MQSGGIAIKRHGDYLVSYIAPYLMNLFFRICWIVPKKYLLLLDQTILLHFRSSIDRPLNLPQYPGSNNYISIPEENI
jgi:hypothetical protein